MLELGDGSQCATTTASGATMDAASAWFAQKTEMAGVAAFASAVSSKTALGKYAAYFVKIESPCDSGTLIFVEVS